MGAQAVRLSNVDIDNALKNKDFEVLFQPIFDLGNGALARVETFVRWRHPSLGILPPGAFISFFESQGRMGELTRYVLSEAIGQYVAWRGPSAPGFSINLAPSDLSDEAFSSHFEVLLRDSGFPSDLITLECPMPPVTMPPEAAAAHFRRLSETGARLAIEVRGRANDFLRTIDPFPFDEIKTGGSAILRFARTVRGPGLSAISELLDISAKANAAITAVGVEDQASLAALRGLGFAAAQGNHLGKVGPLSDFAPSRVNEVRKLLGLEPLSTADLQALFRTETPAPQPTARPAPAAVAAPSPATTSEPQDDLVERLAARLARQPSPEQLDAAEPAAEEEKPMNREAAKAVAIARAKRKAAQQAADPAPALPDIAAARSLQQRLSREFTPPPRQAPPEPEPVSARTPAPVAEPPAAAPIAAAPAPASRPHTDEQPSHKPEHLEPAAAEPDYQEPAASAPVPSSEPAGEAAPPRRNPPAAPRSATLAIAGARAYFRPGLRISAMAPLPAPPRSNGAPPRPDNVVAAPARFAAEDDNGVLWEEDDAATGAATVPAQETFTPEASDPADARPASETAPETNTPPAPRRKRRSKNVLTRKYRLLPTHFWPKSWKRAWRRQRESKAAE